MKMMTKMIFTDNTSIGEQLQTIFEKVFVFNNTLECINHLVEFEKTLDRNRVNDIIVVSDDGESYKNICVANNIIKINNRHINKIINEINWIKNGFKKMNDTSKIFFISDTHFNHTNIIRPNYANRPWQTVKDDGSIDVTPENVAEMNEAIIKNWNSVVGKDDVVYHLGDFALGDRSKIPELVSRLNGKIYLIIGNHDWFNIKDKTKYSGVKDFLRKSGFADVYDHPILFNKFFMLSHEPVEWIEDGGVYANIHGHVHNNPMFKNASRNSFNCSVEVINYTPVSFDEILKRMQSFEPNTEE